MSDGFAGVVSLQHPKVIPGAPWYVYRGIQHLRLGYSPNPSAVAILRAGLFGRLARRWLHRHPHILVVKVLYAGENGWALVHVMLTTETRT